jgi:hypothetical protein
MAAVAARRAVAGHMPAVAAARMVAVAAARMVAAEVVARMMAAVVGATESTEVDALARGRPGPGPFSAARRGPERSVGAAGSEFVSLSATTLHQQLRHPRRPHANAA